MPLAHTGGYRGCRPVPAAPKPSPQASVSATPKRPYAQDADRLGGWIDRCGGEGLGVWAPALVWNLLAFGARRLGRRSMPGVGAARIDSHNRTSHVGHDDPLDPADSSRLRWWRPFPRRRLPWAGFRSWRSAGRHPGRAAGDGRGMTDKPSPSTRSLLRASRDHGLKPDDLAKAVRKERAEPLSDRMNVGEA